MFILMGKKIFTILRSFFFYLNLCRYKMNRMKYLLAFLSLASFGALFTLRAVGVNLVTSPRTFLIWGLAVIVAVSFFSSTAFWGCFIILGGAERTLGFCGAGATPGGGGNPGGNTPGGPDGGLIILGGGIPGKRRII